MYLTDNGMCYTLSNQITIASKARRWKIKKIVITPQQLNRIIELRQLGTNWSDIEDKIEVDRRLVKKAYEVWEEDKKAREQREVRFRVTAEAFHEHLKELISLADKFINVIEMPVMITGLKSADQTLERLWQEDSNLKNDEYNAQQQTDRAKEREVWRNKKLFESLQEHTREKVDWQLLEEWKQARDNAMNYSGKLHVEITKIIRRKLNKYAVLVDYVTHTEQCNDLAQVLSEGICESIWHGLYSNEAPYVEAIKYNLSQNGEIRLNFYKHDSKIRLSFHDEELAKSARDLCRLTIKKLQKNPKSILHSLYGTVHTIQKDVEHFEHGLDKTVLKPVLLKTHCDLCPT